MRRRQDVARRIQHIDAAIGELGQLVRVEEDVPAVDRLDAERLRHLLGVVAEADGAPHVVDGIFVARIVFGGPLQ